MARGNTVSPATGTDAPHPTVRAPRITKDINKRLPWPDQKRVLLASGGLALLLVAWAVAILASDRVSFATLAPRAQVGVEAAASFSRLFGALVLFLFPSERAGRRLRWVAMGFVVLGIGGLVFGYLRSLLGITPDQNTLTYAALVVRTLAGALFVVGLAPASPPHLGRWMMITVLALFSVLSTAVVMSAGLLPQLSLNPDLESAAVRGEAPLHGLTAWHWTFSMLPLGLSVAAAVGTARHLRQDSVGVWLLPAMVLQAGSQLHNLFWPSVYSSVLTTGDLLRLAFAAVVIAGGVFELRRIAEEREALLAVEQEHSRRLEELAALRADFTAMVAHELGNPLAAIRGLTKMLGTGRLSPDEQAETLATIRAEADVLTALVADVQTSATIEREDFCLQVRPVSIDSLLADVSAYAKTLPGDHPLTTRIEGQVVVSADPERIGQVLRNLLSNAAKYSPPGAPIEIRAIRIGRRVRIEVADNGYGIHPEDLNRIFEKFGRGRDQSGQRVHGVGLGLYLCRRIVRAHGSELHVESTLGVGSVFGFDLEVVS